MIITFIVPLHLKKAGLSRVAEEVIKRLKNHPSFSVSLIHSPSYGYLKPQILKANFKNFFLTLKEFLCSFKKLLMSDCVIILEIPTFL